MIKRAIALPGLIALALCSCNLIPGLGPNAKAGDPCDGEGKQVCLSKETALACHGGKWEAMPCHGITGCIGAGEDASCNNDYAKDGDVCNRAGDFVCTEDKKAMLTCDQNHWKLEQKCLGQNGCQVNVREVRCDTSIAEPGASCQSEGAASCSPDGAAQLVCKGGKYEVDRPCKGRYGCRKQFDKIECNE